MKSITQNMRWRQSLTTYGKNHGVRQASRKYSKSRSYIYFWVARYDGGIDSLKPKSKRLKHHPNQHTQEEIKLITDMRRCNPDLGVIELWHRMRQRGYSRCPESLYRNIHKLNMFPKEKPKQKYTAPR